MPTASPSASSSVPHTHPHPPPHSSPSPAPSIETLHPLLAPIGAPSISNPPAAPRTPEKCLTFCSQRADAPPLCRMFCLRRRAKVLSRGEELSRLKGRDIRKERADESSASESSSMASSSGTSSTTGESSGLKSILPSKWSFNPFEALRRAVDPYSIIYIRGTPDGVVGRYMEEMEYDDGNRDFGESISRHAKQRGREERVMEYLDWGDDGALLHLPLTSVVHPITSIPSTVRTIFTPSYNMLSLYLRSFTDGNGTQLRGAQNFLASAYNLDALTFLGKVRDHHQKTVKERFENEQEKRKEMQKVLKADLDRQLATEKAVKENMEGFKVEGEEGKRYQAEIDRLKTGGGGSGLRRKIEEAMERDEEFRRKRAAEGQKGEGGGKSNEV